MKNKLIVTALILVATMCVSLMSGCWVDSARIKFTEEPAKTYYVGDSIGDFVLYDMDEKKEYRYSEYQSQITISGFNTEVPGTFVATITMGDYSLEWSYEVIASDAEFAGGSGTVTDPYLVANYVQFNNMLAKVNTAKVYYKLANDIDFAGHEVVSGSDWYANNGEAYFNGVVDGNGYKVMNVCDIKDISGAKKFNEIFGVVGADFALKNIEFNFVSEGANACTGLVTTVYPKATNANIQFNKVTVKGFIDLTSRNATSVGGFIAQADRSSDPVNAYSITECVNELNIYNGSSVRFVAGYVNTQRASRITFTGNTYNGTIEGGADYTAAFIGAFNNGSLENATIAENTIKANSSLVVVNNVQISGPFACSAPTSEKFKGSVESANTAYGEYEGYLTKLAGGKLEGSQISEIAENVVTIKVTYSTSYIGKDSYAAAIMNSGVLSMVAEYEVNGATSISILVPTVILQNGQPEGAKSLVTPGMYYFTDDNGVTTFYTNRPDPALGKKLSAIAVGYDANGKIVWTTGKFVELSATYANGL